MPSNSTQASRGRHHDNSPILTEHPPPFSSLYVPSLLASPEIIARHKCRRCVIFSVSFVERRGADVSLMGDKDFRNYSFRIYGALL